MEVVNPGDRVRIRCASRLDDGTCLDSPADREKPYWIRAGQALASRTVSEGVLGMRIGEQKTLTIRPEQGFGRSDPGKVYRADIATLPGDVKVGDRVAVDGPGKDPRAVVRSIGLDHAMLDANHRHADRTLTLAVEVVAIKKG